MYALIVDVTLLLMVCYTTTSTAEPNTSTASGHNQACLGCLQLHTPAASFVGGHRFRRQSLPERQSSRLQLRVFLPRSQGLDALPECVDAALTQTLSPLHRALGQVSSLRLTTACRLLSTRQSLALSCSLRQAAPRQSSPASSAIHCTLDGKLRHGGIQLDLLQPTWLPSRKCAKQSRAAPLTCEMRCSSIAAATPAQEFGDRLWPLGRNSRCLAARRLIHVAGRNPLLHFKGKAGCESSMGDAVSVASFWACC